MDEAADIRRLRWRKKLIEAWKWVVDPSGLKYCEAACGSYGGGDCEKCENRAPRLLSRNIEAWKLWSYACTQWRTSMAGIVGIDYTAVKTIAKALNIKMDTVMISKIHALESYELGRMAEEAKKHEQ